MRKLLTGLWMLAFCAMTTLLFPPTGYAQQALLPNLQPFPAFDLRLSFNSTGGKEIRFSVTSFNWGLGPLELIAGGTSDAGQDVYQRVYYSDGSHKDYFAGTFVWHPAHNHFHFGDYALYKLDPVNAPGGSSKNGSKTTFCIMDTTKVDGNLPGAAPQAVYDTCGNTVQGMSVGWGDTYGYALAGQSVDFTGNPSGDYCLTVQIDPKGKLCELDEDFTDPDRPNCGTSTDNTVSSLLRIDVERSTITVLDATSCSPNGAVAVASIAPNTGTVGTTEQITIKGSGFAQGMSVSFANGSGPAPTAKNVVVSADGTTIQATVAIKKGKPGKNPVWDVIVGAGTLFNGFTVQQ
jgi:Lysyl oxidase